MKHKFKIEEVVRSVSAYDQKEPFLRVLAIDSIDNKPSYLLKSVNSGRFGGIMRRSENQLRHTERDYAGDF